MLWNLDKNPEKSIEFCKKHKFDQNTHKKFKIGQCITFWTGYNDDIRAVATIKGFDSDGGIYVYTDCYWYPIVDNAKYAIKTI